MRLLALLVAPLRAACRAWEHRHDSYPEGCCGCGTGGRRYRGSEPQVTRYLYAGAMLGGSADRFDWASCSRHPEVIWPARHPDPADEHDEGDPGLTYQMCDDHALPGMTPITEA